MGLFVLVWTNKVIHNETKFINRFVDVPVSTMPLAVVELVFNIIQPMLSACINSALVYKRKECLSWRIFEWASMTENYINLPVDRV